MRSCQVTPRSTPVKWRNKVELGPDENTAHGTIASMPLAPVDVAISQHTQRKHPRCEPVTNEDSQCAGDWLDSTAKSGRWAATHHLQCAPHRELPLSTAADQVAGGATTALRVPPSFARYSPAAACPPIRLSTGRRFMVGEWPVRWKASGKRRPSTAIRTGTT
jgi:hypothetical protein